MGPDRRMGGAQGVEGRMTVRRGSAAGGNRPHTART